MIELRKTAKAAVVEVKTKEAELKALKASLAELSALNEKLIEQINMAEADKQKALP